MATVSQLKPNSKLRENPPKDINVFVIIFKTEEDNAKGFKVIHPLGSVTERVVKREGKEEAWNFVNRAQLEELKRQKGIQFDVL